MNTFTMPKTFEDFCEEYAFKDKKEVYTNGSELVQTFRVKQWLEMNGYFSDVKCLSCRNFVTHKCIDCQYRTVGVDNYEMEE